MTDISDPNTKYMFNMFPWGICKGVYIGQTSISVKDRTIAPKSDCILHPDRCAFSKHIHSLGNKMYCESTRASTF